MNRIYLTCRHHPTKSESYLLADRNDRCDYVESVRPDRLQKWLDKHAHCSGTFDHFTLSYQEQKDADLPTVGDAVDRALRVVK